MPDEEAPPAAMPHVFIDLGEEHGTVPETEAAGGPRVRVRLPRPVRLAVPTLAALFLLSAAAHAAPVPLPPVARIPVAADDHVAVVGSAAVVLGTRSGRGVIRSYNLDAKRQGFDWSAALDVAPADADVRLIAGVVVAETQSPGGGATLTEAFDARTGERLWRSRDALSEFGPAADVTLQTPATGGGTVLHRVDVRSGATRWTLPIPANCSTQDIVDPTHGVADGLVEMCFDPSMSGARTLFHPILRVVDMVSGTVRASRSLDLAVDPSLLRSEGGLPQPQVAIVDGLVVLLHVNIPFSMADAFRVADLRPVWSSVAIADLDALQRCGVTYCLATTDGVATIDPATGALGPGAGPTQISGLGTLNFLLIPVGSMPLTVVSAPEGQTVAVPAAGADRVWLVGERAVGDGGQPLRTLIEQLDGVDANACLRMGDYLVCATSPDDLTLWRLPT